MNIKRTLAMTVAATALTAGVAVPQAEASLNLFTNCPVISLVSSILGGTTTPATSTPTKSTGTTSTTKSTTSTTKSTGSTTKSTGTTTKSTGTTSTVGNV